MCSDLLSFLTQILPLLPLIEPDSGATLSLQGVRRCVTALIAWNPSKEGES